MAKLMQPPQLVRRWEATLDDHVIDLAWSSDGSTLASASISGPITLFDANGAVKHLLLGHSSGTSSLSWHPDGRVLASGGQDGKLRFWDAISGKETGSVEGGAPWVDRVAWRPRGDCIASIAGKKLRLWSPDGEPLRNYPEALHTISDLRWSPKGKELATAGYGGVSFWSPDADEPRVNFPLIQSLLTVAWSPDAQCLAAGTQEGLVHFWFTRSGKDLEMSGYPRKVQELSWDASSTYLATGGGPVVTVWDCSGKKGPSRSVPISFELHKEPVSVLAFQHRGPLLASGSQEGLLALWCPGTSSKVLGQAQLEEGISTLSWTPTDGRLAVGGASGKVQVYGV